MASGGIFTIKSHFDESDENVQTTITHFVPIQSHALPPGVEDEGNKKKRQDGKAVLNQYGFLCV